MSVWPNHFSDTFSHRSVVQVFKLLVCFVLYISANVDILDIWKDLCQFGVFLFLIFVILVCYSGSQSLFQLYWLMHIYVYIRGLAPKIFAIWNGLYEFRPMKLVIYVHLGLLFSFSITVWALLQPTPDLFYQHSTTSKSGEDPDVQWKTADYNSNWPEHIKATVSFLVLFKLVYVECWMQLQQNSNWQYNWTSVSFFKPVYLRLFQINQSCCLLYCHSLDWGHPLGLWEFEPYYNHLPNLHTPFVGFLGSGRLCQISSLRDLAKE